MTTWHFLFFSLFLTIPVRGYFIKSKFFEKFNLECNQQEAVYGIDVTYDTNKTFDDIQIQLYCRKLVPEGVVVSNNEEKCRYTTLFSPLLDISTVGDDSRNCDCNEYLVGIEGIVRTSSIRPVPHRQIRLRCCTGANTYVDVDTCGRIGPKSLVTPTEISFLSPIDLYSENDFAEPRQFVTGLLIRKQLVVAKFCQLVSVPTHGAASDVKKFIVAGKCNAEYANKYDSFESCNSNEIRPTDSWETIKANSNVSPNKAFAPQYFQCEDGKAIASLTRQTVTGDKTKISDVQLSGTCEWMEKQSCFCTWATSCDKLQWYSTFDSKDKFRRYVAGFKSTFDFSSNKRNEATFFDCQWQYNKPKLELQKRDVIPSIKLGQVVREIQYNNTNGVNYHVCNVTENSDLDCWYTCKNDATKTGYRKKYRRTACFLPSGETLKTGQTKSVQSKKFTCTQQGDANPVLKSEAVRSVHTLATGTDCRLQQCKIKPATTAPNCNANGDPHYRTFDGFKHDYQGSCKLVATRNLNSEGPQFQVLLKASSYGFAFGDSNMPFTYVESVEVFAYDQVIKLNRFGPVQVNGIDVSVPYFYPQSDSCDTPCLISVTQYGSIGRLVNTDLGLAVEYDGVQSMDISIPDAAYLRGNTGGICGVWDNDPRNDLQLPSGDMASNYNIFGDAWVVDDPTIEKCDTYRDQPVSDCPFAKRQRALQQCEVLKNRGGPFSACFGDFAVAKESDRLHDNCLFDLCSFGNQEEVRCRAIESFAGFCRHRVKNANINWRGPTGCGAKCPEHMTYQSCTTACPATCRNLKPKSCSKPCVDDCVCDNGYVLHHGKCVPLAECGCVDDEQNVRKKGENWVGPGCTKSCTCSEGGVISCAESSCAPPNSCTVEKGRRKCDCGQGFRRLGVGCEDIDECVKNPKICGSKATCKNNFGSYECICKPEFVKSDGFCVSADSKSIKKSGGKQMSERFERRHDSIRGPTVNFGNIPAVQSPKGPKVEIARPTGGKQRIRDHSKSKENTTKVKPSQNRQNVSSTSRPSTNETITTTHLGHVKSGNVTKTPKPTDPGVTPSIAKTKRPKFNLTRTSAIPTTLSTSGNVPITLATSGNVPATPTTAPGVPTTTERKTKRPRLHETTISAVPGTTLATTGSVSTTAATTPKTNKPLQATTKESLSTTVATTATTAATTATTAATTATTAATTATTAATTATTTATTATTAATTATTAATTATTKQPKRTSEDERKHKSNEENERKSTEREHNKEKSETEGKVKSDGKHDSSGGSTTDVQSAKKEGDKTIMVGAHHKGPHEESDKMKSERKHKENEDESNTDKQAVKDKQAKDEEDKRNKAAKEKEKADREERRKLERAEKDRGDRDKAEKVERDKHDKEKSDKEKSDKDKAEKEKADGEKSKGKKP